uniref:Uncharacterized protein n=1 Tax=Acidobacterium capsulatum TaxID=33075 RepID=A0A7V4XUD6_9BACT
MAKQCRHVKANGAQCRANRLWKEDYCFFHLHHRTPHGMVRRTEEAPPQAKSGCEIPLLEDTASVQIALTRVLSAMTAGKLTPAEANSYINGLRLAARNVKNGLGLAGGESIECFVQYENGDVVGPGQFPEEKKTEHPLLETSMIEMRYLAARLEYEALIDAYLTAGKEPPGDLRPPTPKPTEESQIEDWVKLGWKAAQTRAQAIELARKGMLSDEPIKADIADQNQ